MQVFNPLREGSVRAIAAKLLHESAERAASALGLAVTYSDALTARVCAAGMDIDTGARKLRRAVIAIVDDPLSEYVLREGDVAGRVVLVDTTPDDVTVVSEVVAECEAERERALACAGGPDEHESRARRRRGGRAAGELRFERGDAAGGASMLM